MLTYKKGPREDILLGLPITGKGADKAAPIYESVPM